jgi:hypothetical protein
MGENREKGKSIAGKELGFRGLKKLELKKNGSGAGSCQ